MLGKPIILILLNWKSAQPLKPFLGIISIMLLVILSAPFWREHYLAVLEPADSALQGRTIIIDPGHGGTDPGAMYKGTAEKDINLAVALKVRELLEKRGAKVILTRSTDVDFYTPREKGTSRELKRSELDKRVQIAKQAHGDIFISIHTNQDRHSDCYGIETFYHPLSNAGRIAAVTLQRELVKLHPANHRKAKGGDYYLLRNTNMPALIVEVGFISNREERELLQQGVHQQKIAQAIVSGLQKYYGNNSGLNNSPTGNPKTNNPPNHSAAFSKPSTNQLELYFLKQSPTGDHLALETRTLDQLTPTLSAGNSSQKLKKIALTAMEELLKGPNQSNLEPIFPEGTKLLSLEIEGSKVKLNFSKELVENFSGSLEEENDFILAIHKTLTQFPGLTEVEILVEGQREASPGGHLYLNTLFRENNLERKVKLAIVIDDLGQNARGTSEMMALPYPLTFAIMPNMKNSQEEARLAVQKGYQVIIHMPMSPELGKPGILGPGAITPDLSDAEVVQRVRLAIEQLPQAVGFSNHTGSKVTANRAIMQVVLKELKAKNLFILDSRTTDKTVIPELAREMSVPWAERTVFLDNVNRVASINSQIDLLADIALEKGEAIGIGHVGETGSAMVKALTDRLPQMKARGVVIVPVSELVKK